MSRAQQIQGVVFSACALLLAAASAVLPRLQTQTELVAVAVVVTLLGVPHGGLDAVFARQLYDVRTIVRWAAFGALYGLLAAAVVGCSSAPHQESVGQMSRFSATDTATVRRLCVHPDSVLAGQRACELLDQRPLRRVF